MLKKEIVLNELAQLKEYLLNPGTEKAKDYLVFPAVQEVVWKQIQKRIGCYWCRHLY